MAKKKARKTSTTKKAPKKAAKRKAHKRELIDTGRDKRYVRRNNVGQFNEVDEQSRSLAADRRKKAKKKVKAGQGDKGDQAKRKKRKKR